MVSKKNKIISKLVGSPVGLRGGLGEYQTALVEAI